MKTARKRILFKKKDFIIDERQGKQVIRNCDTNIATMNWLEHTIYAAKGYYPFLFGHFPDMLKTAWEGIAAVFIVIFMIFSVFCPIPLLFIQSTFRLFRAKNRVRKEAAAKSQRH